MIESEDDKARRVIRAFQAGVISREDAAQCLGLNQKNSIWIGVAMLFCQKHQRVTPFHVWRQVFDPDKYSITCHEDPESTCSGQTKPTCSWTPTAETQIALAIARAMEQARVLRADKSIT